MNIKPFATVGGRIAGCKITPLTGRITMPVAVARLATLCVIALPPALAPLPAQGGDITTGAAKAKVENCAACHGADGISTTPQFPNLAGQHAEYLVQTLKDYQSGARANAVMGSLVGNLSVQDIEDLAAFYASQTGLFTPSAKD